MLVLEPGSKPLGHLSWCMVCSIPNVKLVLLGSKRCGLYQSTHASVSVRTLSDCQCGCVDQEQQNVVEKDLEHRRVSMEVISQVFAGQTDSTD